MMKVWPTTTASEAWAGWAKREIRRLLGFVRLPYAHTYALGGGVYAHIKLTREGYYSAILWGGADPFHILLTNYERADAYSYYTDILTSAVVADGVDTSYPLSPLYNGRSQLGDNAYIKYDPSWSSEVIGNPYQFLGGVNEYEIGIFHDGADIYARTGDTIGNIATVPDTFLQDYAKPYGSLFGLPAYKAVPAWNQYRGLILYTLNPANQTLQDSWYWVPSFFSAAPADAYGLKPGFYYGKYPAPKYGGENALTSANVSFKGIVDTRYTGGEYNYGWCELVRDIDGVTQNDLRFYFQSSPLAVPSNDYFANIRIVGTTNNQFITVGSELPGFEESLTIPMPAVEPDVDMWNFNIWTDPTDIILDQTSGVGIALVSGQSASFYRWSGYQSTVYQTETYHSHSTSRDGTILAIFESDDGTIITRVQVFDLYGTRDAVEGGEYTSGGYTHLRDSGDVVAAEALTGCVIPFRAEEFEPSVVGYDLTTAVPQAAPSDYTDYLPSLSHLFFPKTGVGSPQIRKIVCTNGVDASYGISDDECFSSTVVIEDPLAISATEKKVGSWNEGGVIRGLVRGNFTGNHPNMRFAGVGSGEEVTLPETFSILEDESGVLSFEGYVGDLEIGNCITTGPSGYIPDPECEVSCGGEDFEMTASSSCGQSASRAGEGTAPSALTISGPTTAEVGDEYVASGGVAPYTFTFSGGTITTSGDTGTIATVGACSQGTFSSVESWSEGLFGLYLQMPIYLTDTTTSQSCYPAKGSPDNILNTWPTTAGTGSPFRYKNITVTYNDTIYWYGLNLATTSGCASYPGTTGKWTNAAYYWWCTGSVSVPSNCYTKYPTHAFRLRTAGTAPSRVFHLDRSTSFNCWKTVTVEDACGSTASIDVQAVP